MDSKYVSRGGTKLEHALREFNLKCTGLICFDIGSSTGGFVDCLLQQGAIKVYSLDTAYGELAWKLRQDERVVVMEKTNILHFTDFPAPVDLVTIDVTFTPLKKILPVAKNFLKEGGKVVALLKPQYEDQKVAMKHKNRGVVPSEDRDKILADSLKAIAALGWVIENQTTSPITGTGGNTEYLVLLSQVSP